MNTKKLKAFFLCTGFALIAAAYTTPAFAAERVTASGLTLEITETLTINSEDACRLTSDGIIVANKGSADFNITGISYTPELAGYTLVENKDIAYFQAMEAGSNKYSLIIDFKGRICRKVLLHRHVQLSANMKSLLCASAPFEGGNAL